jgi:hypothetical protein
MPERIADEIGCGFLDQHDLRLLNNRIFVLLFSNWISGIWGCVIHRWKGLEKYLCDGILHTPKRSEISVAKWKRTKYVVIQRLQIRPAF